jgi:hypothetical protein
MIGLRSFQDEDGSIYDVPPDKMAEFQAAAPKARPVQAFKGADGAMYDVPKDREQEFLAASPGAEPVRSVRTLNGDTFDVPDSKREAFYQEFKSNPAFEADREEARAKAKASAQGPGPGNVVLNVAKGIGQGTVSGIKDAGKAAATAMIEDIPSLIWKPLAVVSGGKHTALGRYASDISDQIDDAAAMRTWDDPEVEGWAAMGPQAFRSVVTQLVPALATGGASATVMPALYGLRRVKDVHDAAIRTGMSKEKAAALAVGAGALEGGVEYVSMLWGGGKTAKDTAKAMLGTGAKTVLKNLLKQAAVETGTEFVQEGGGALIDQTSEGQPLDPVQALEAAALGAGTAVVSVGLMGGPGQVAKSVDARRAKKLEGDQIKAWASANPPAPSVNPEQAALDARTAQMQPVFEPQPVAPVVGPGAAAGLDLRPAEPMQGQPPSVQPQVQPPVAPKAEAPVAEFRHGLEEDSYVRDLLGKESAPFFDGSKKVFRGTGEEDVSKKKTQNGMTFFTDDPGVAKTYASRLSKNGRGTLVSGQLAGHYFDLTDQGNIYRLRTDIRKRGLGAGLTEQDVSDAVKVLESNDLDIFNTTNKKEYDSGWSAIQKYFSTPVFGEGIKGVVFLDQHFAGGGYSKTYAKFDKSPVLENKIESETPEQAPAEPQGEVTAEPPAAESPATPAVLPLAPGVQAAEPPPVAPDVLPPMEKLDRAQTHALNEAEASKRLGWNIRRGQTVLIMMSETGGPYKKPIVGKVFAVQGGGIVRVSYQKKGDSSQKTQDISIDRIAQTPQAKGMSARTEKLAGLTPEERKSVGADEKAVKKILAENAMFGDVAREEYISNSKVFKRETSIAEAQYKTWKIENAAKMAGLTDFDPKDPRDIARLLPHVQRMLSEHTVSTAKYQEPTSADTENLNQDDIVWADGELHMVSKTDGGDVTKLQDGRTQTFKTGENVNIQAHFRPGEPAYERAVAEYQAQEAKLRDEEAMRQAVESSMDRPVEEQDAQEPAPAAPTTPPKPVASALKTQADTSLAGKTPQELLDLAAPFTQYGQGYSRNIATSVQGLKIAMEPGREKFMHIAADELAVRLDAVLTKPAAPAFSLESQTPEQAPAERAKLAEQQAARAQQDEIARRAAAPITGNTGDLGQGGLPGLPGAVEENLFNRPAAPAEMRAAGGGGPRGPAPTVPPWALDPAESKTGRRLIDLTVKAKAGMREIIKFLNDAVGADMRFSKSQTSKRYPANYRPLGNLIFTRDNQSQINFHEAGHGLKELMEAKSPGVFSPMKTALLDLTQWPDSMASAENIHEGVAEWVRLKVTDPAKLEGKPIDAQMMAAVNTIIPNTGKALRDAARALHKFNELPDTQQWKMLTKETRDAPGAKEFIDAFYRGGKKLAEQIASGAPVSRIDRTLTRKIKQGWREMGITRELALAKAREIRTTHLSPLLYAYNYILSINVEVSNAMEGKGPSRGLQIIGRNGKRRMILKETWQEIIKKVKASQWEQFEQAGWAAESLSRFEQDGYEYPGMLGGMTPDKLKSIVDQAKIDIPDFQARFDNVQAYFDALLDIRDFGGMKKAGEVDKMRRRGSYWPLPPVMDKYGKSKGGRGSIDSQSGDFKAHGSGEQIRSLNEWAEEKTSETLNNYAANQFRLAIVDHLRAVAKDKSLPKVARDIAGREFVRMKLPQAKAAALKQDEGQLIVYEYIVEQEAARTGESRAEVKARIPLESVNVSWDYKDLFRPTKPGDLNVISLLRDGEREYYQVGDDGMYNMFAQAGRPVNQYIKAIDWAIGPSTQNLKRMITQIPAFAYTANLWRDGINQMFNNPGAMGWVPWGVTFKGIVNRWTKKYPQVIQEGELLSRSARSESETLNQLRSGVVWQFMTDGLYIARDKDPVTRVLKTALQPSNWLFPIIWKPVDVINLVTTGRWASQYGESVTREGGAVEVLQRGGTDAEALDAHWRNSVRFNEGAVDPNVRKIISWGMFVNPMIQGTRQAMMNLTDPDPATAGKAWAKMLIEIPAIFILAAIFRYKLMDDEDKEKEKERPFYDKMNYHDVGGFRIAFPSGPEGAMASIAYTATMDYLLDRPKEETRKTVKMLTRNIFSIGTPVRFFGPQATALIEATDNWSNFRQAHIVSPWMKDLPASEQYNSDTPAFYRKLGEWINYSPAKLEYITQQALSRQLDETIRLIDNPKLITDPQERADIPYIGRMFIRNPAGFGSASVDRLGDIDARMMLLNRKLNAAGLDFLTDTSEKARHSTPPPHLFNLKMQLRTLENLKFVSSGMKKHSKAAQIAHKNGDFDQEANIKTAMMRLAQSALAANPEAVERISTALDMIEKIQTDAGQQ